LALRSKLFFIGKLFELWLENYCRYISRSFQLFQKENGKAQISEIQWIKKVTSSCFINIITKVYSRMSQRMAVLFIACTRRSISFISSTYLNHLFESTWSWILEPIFIILKIPPVKHWQFIGYPIFLCHNYKKILFVMPRTNNFYNQCNCFFHQ
jgi:hypothetical protein